MIKLIVSFLSLGLIFLNLSVAEEASYHSVENNHCLSCLAESYIGYPIYGEKGSLELLLSLNPGIQNRDLIRTSQNIALPSNQQLSSYRKSKISPDACMCGSVSHPSGYAQGLKGSSVDYSAMSDQPIDVSPVDVSPVETPSYDESVSNEVMAVEADNSVVQEDTGIKNRYYIGATTYHDILLATDRGSSSEAEWVSETGYAAEAAYQRRFGKFWLGAKLGYYASDYEVENSATFTWDEDTPRLIKASLISDYETNNWAFGLDVDFNTELFIYEQGLDIELRDVLMIGASLRGSYKWYNSESWSSRLGLKLEYPVTGSDDIDPEGELGYIGSVDFKKHDVFRGLDFNAKLFYGFRNLTNNQNDQEQEIIGLSFGLSSEGWF